VASQRQYRFTQRALPKVRPTIIFRSSSRKASRPAPPEPRPAFRIFCINCHALEELRAGRSEIFGAFRVPIDE